MLVLSAGEIRMLDRREARAVALAFSLKVFISPYDAFYMNSDVRTDRKP